MRKVRLPSENPSLDTLLALGAALDLVTEADSTEDPEGEIWPSTSHAAWQRAYAAMEEAVRICDEARAACEREAVSRARAAGWHCCAVCLAWKPAEELKAVVYGAEAASKGGTTRRYFECHEHKGGDHGGPNGGLRSEGSDSNEIFGAA